jgi:hypothetical protein
VQKWSLNVNFVRQTIGDVLLAFLVAVPATSLAQPGTVSHHRAAGLSAPAQKSVLALASTADRQVGLYR